MKAGTKLAIYGAGLLATFGAAYGLAGAPSPAAGADPAGPDQPADMAAPPAAAL